MMSSVTAVVLLLSVVVMLAVMVIVRAHSFPREKFYKSAVYLANSAVHRGKADEIPRLTAVTQLNIRGLIKP